MGDEPADTHTHTVTQLTLELVNGCLPDFEIFSHNKVAFVLAHAQYTNVRVGAWFDHCQRSRAVIPHTLYT